MPLLNNRKHRTKPTTQLDRGWAWVVLAAAAFNLCVDLGISLGSGVYVSEVIKNWEVSKANAALLGSVLYGIMFCFGPVTTFLASKTSNRTMVIVGGLVSSIGLVASANVTGIIALYCTFSVMGGIGNGMVFLQSIVMVNLYFKKYRGLASGITLAGGGIGLLVIPLLERTLIAHFTWQPSLYIVAGICLNTCVAGTLMKPVNLPFDDVDAAKSVEDNVYVIRGQSLTKNRPFILFCASSFIWGLAVTVPIILSSDFYEDCKMNGFQINILLSCFGIGNLLGRLVGGVICNIRVLDKLVLYSVTTSIVGVNIGLFTLTSEFVYLAILASSFGCTFGIFIVSHTVASACVVETSKIERSITVSYFINGLALVMGPPLAGALFDVTSSYTWPFLVSALAMLIAALIVIPGICCKKPTTTMTMVIEEKNICPVALSHPIVDSKQEDIGVW